MRKRAGRARLRLHLTIFFVSFFCSFDGSGDAVQQEVMPHYVGVCMSCISYPTTCSPKGYGSGLPLPSDSAPIFPPLKTHKDPDPIPNDMSVTPGLPDLLPPLATRQRKSRTRTRKRKEKKRKERPDPSTPTPPSPFPLPPGPALPSPAPRPPCRPLPPPPERSGSHPREPPGPRPLSPGVGGCGPPTPSR